MGVLWQSKRSRPQSISDVAQREDKKEWPLTKEIVSRSLQTQAFRTEKLRRKSDHEIVWRWLRESIAAYPRNWIKLTVSDQQTYEIVLYRLKTMDLEGLSYYNRELSEKGMPLLREGKRYLPITVYQGNIECPNWSGLVDVEEARLVYFAGASG